MSVPGWRRDRRDNAIQRNLPSIMANKLISAVSGVRLPRFWLFAEGLSCRGARRHPPLRRNASVSSDLREVAWSAHYGDPGQPFRAIARIVEVWP